MNNYKEIQAKVLRVDEEEHKFILEVDNKIYKVAQLAFQRRLPTPEYLDCLLISSHVGKVFISQNIERLMRQHYQENDEVIFKIKLTLGEYYQLEDEFGFTAMLKRDTVNNSATEALLFASFSKHLFTKLMNSGGHSLEEREGGSAVNMALAVQSE